MKQIVDRQIIKIKINLAESILDKQGNKQTDEIIANDISIHLNIVKFKDKVNTYSGSLIRTCYWKKL